MANMLRLRRLVSLVLTVMFLLPLWFAILPMDQVSAGTAKITSFEGDFPTKTLDFTNQKVNDTLGFRLPKAAKVTSASMDVQAVMVNEPGKITLDTRADFMAARPIDLDLNKSINNALIIERQNLSDQFNDGVLDTTNWSWMNPPFSVNENAGTGMLEITSNANTNWTGTTQTGSFLYKQVEGNFMAITKISCWPDKNQESCGLMVYSDSNNWFQEVLKYRKYGNNGGQMMVFKKRQGGVNAQDAAFGNVANPVYMKITRHYDTFTVSISNNPKVYTEVQKFTWVLPSTLRVGAVVYDGLEAGVNFRADYDFINITRYIDYGNMSIGPINTQFPIVRVHMDQDLRQLEVWETFEVFVRSNTSGQWQPLIGDTDTLITTPGTTLEMRVSIGGKGWTTPLLRWVTLDYFPESWPSGVSLDVGADGTVEWWYNQTMSIKAAVNNPEFMSALETLRSQQSADIQGYVHIPMRVVSQTKGKLTFQNLAINLFTGNPPKAPILGLPANNTWLGTRTPTFNFSTTDPEADTLTYQVQVSDDNFQTLPPTFVFNQRVDLYGWSMSLYDSGQEARFSMDIGEPLEQGKTYWWRVAAYDGGWWGNFSAVRTFKVDVTLPTGTISDSGASTPINREAFATVDFDDAESGISYIECGLGTQKNKTDIVPMTPVNITTGKVHFTNLTLDDKKMYYFTAHARNQAGIWSINMTTDGIRIDLSLDAPPVVNVTTPANRTMVDGTVMISGTASDANAGDKLLVYVAIDDNPWSLALGSTIWSYDWDTKKVSDGEHRIYVKAFDGMRDSETVNLRVIVGNSQMSFSSWTPSGDASINETEEIEFVVTLRDPAKIFKSYTWSIDGVNVPNSDHANFTYKSTYVDAGVKVIEVKAMGVSMSASHRWNLTVLNHNREPKAAISFPKDGASVTVGKSIVLDGTASSDPDGDALTYSWTFSDGTTATGSRAEKKFKKEGTVTVTLSVKDKFNATSDAQIKVKVTPKKVDIAGQLLSFPLVLIPILIIVGITAGVIFFISRKFKQQKEFEKKIETKIDDSTIDDLLYYNPAPQQPGGAQAGTTVQQQLDASQQYQNPPETGQVQQQYAPDGQQPPQQPGQQGQ